MVYTGFQFIQGSVSTGFTVFIFFRQEYLHDFLYKYYLTKQKQDGGCNHDYRYVCSVMVGAIVEADIK
jgi:hypothetical protein